MAGMSMSSIDSFIQGGSGIAQWLGGYFQTKEANKEIEKLMANYPEWQIPESYKNSLRTVQSLAGSKMPGYYNALSNVDAVTGQSIGAAREGAIGSSQLQDTISKLNQQSLSAKSQLDIASSQYQANAMKALAEAQSKYGDLETKQWDQNINRRWNIERKEQEAKKGYGIQGMYTGMDTFLDSSEKFASSFGGEDFSSMFG